MEAFFSYEHLKLVWWVLIGVLIIAFALTDGFDFGVLTLLRVVAKTNEERQIMIKSIAAHWEGNQTWLVAAASCMLASWPSVFAASFSSFYWAMILLLLGLYMRPGGFDFRDKINTPRWRNNWDWALTAGGLFPSILMGVAVGNLLHGVPFSLDENLRMLNKGTFWQLLNPIALIAGFVSLSMFVAHGSAWLMMSTDGALAERARNYGRLAAVAFIVFFLAGGAFMKFGDIQGLSMDYKGVDLNTGFNPLQKTAIADNPGWLNNYSKHPITIVAPIMALAGALIVLLGLTLSRGAIAFFGSSATIIGSILTVGFALCPFIFPSSVDINSSFTLWDGVSGKKTLMVITVTAAIFIPTISAYTLWGYVKMWGKVYVLPSSKSNVG